MKKLLYAAIALVCAIGLPASAQLTTITASSIKMAGTSVSAGTVTFTPTNSIGTPISLTAGGTLYDPQGFTAAITSGAIDSVFQVPDSCTASATSPSTEVFYQITVLNTATKKSFTLGKVSGVCGSSWALDAYVPTQGAPVTATGLLSGVTVPTKCTGTSIFYTQASPPVAYGCVGGIYVQQTGSGGSSSPATATDYGTVKLATGQTATVLAKVATTGVYSDLTGTPTPLVAGTDYATPASVSTVSTAAAAAQTTASAALPKAGGTMTGAITLAADPTANLQAATKQYVDAVSTVASAAIPATQKGAANGVAPLDVSGKVPIANLPDAVATPYPAAGSNNWYYQTVASTVTAIQSYVTYQVSGPTNTVSFEFGNASGTTETCGPNMTLYLGLEAPTDSTPISITANGLKAIHIAPCGRIRTDPVSIDIPVTNPNVTLRVLAIRDTGETAAIPYNYTAGAVTGSGTAIGSYTTTKTAGHWDGCQQMTSRTVTDAVTNGTTTVTSATAAIASADIYETVTFTNPSDSSTFVTTITSTTNSTTFVTAAAVPFTGTGVTVAFTPTNLTTSGTMANGLGSACYVPTSLFATTVGANANRALGFFGDSRVRGLGADVAQGSWVEQGSNPTAAAAGLATHAAVAGGIPWVNMGQDSDSAQNMASEIGSRSRKLHLAYVKRIVGALCVNDFWGGGRTDTQCEQDILTIAQQLANRSKPNYWGTIDPETTSTDGWLTLANQTVRTSSTVGTYRANYNDWLRDGAPMTCSGTVGVAGVPAAKGASGASIVRTAYYSTTGTLVGAASGSSCAHPMAGVFEISDLNESARNSGLWAVDPNVRTVTGCSMTAASAVLTCDAGSFTAADAKRQVAVPGAGAAGAILVTSINTYTSATQVTLAGSAGTTVSAISTTVDGCAAAQRSCGRRTADGIHQTTVGNALQGAALGALIAGWGNW